MHIGVDGTVLYGAHCGPQTSLWQLLRALARFDTTNRYTVYVPADGPSLAEREPFPDTWQWRFLPFPGRFRLFRIAWQQLVFPWWLARDRCDIVHSPTYVAPVLTLIPIVLTIHDLIALHQPEYAKLSNRIHYGLMMKPSIRRASRIIVPAHEVGEQVIELFPPAKGPVDVIPFGVEDSFFQNCSPELMERVRTEYGLPEKFVFFVGNFEPKKNLKNILKAFELAPDLPPLVIAGGGMAWGEAAGQLSLYSRGAGAWNGRTDHKVLGYVPREVLPALFRLCQVFLFPSLAEGFGMPVLEAMGCGAPVITSREVKLPGLDGCVVFCDPQDPLDIAQQTRQLLADPARRHDYAVRGQEYARHFTWQATSQKTMETYARAKREEVTR